MTSEQKVFNYLTELHTVLKYGVEASPSKIARANNVSTSYGLILKKAGVITSVPGTKAGKYKWTGGKPSYQMARECIKMHSKYMEDNIRENSAKKELKKTTANGVPKVEIKPMEVVMPKFYQLRFLGISIKITPVYK